MEGTRTSKHPPLLPDAPPHPQTPPSLYLFPSLSLLADQHFRQWMRHQRITPSERLWRIRLGKYDVVIHDEMREHHLCHD